MDILRLYGATDRLIGESGFYEGLTLSRVISQNKGIYKLITPDGEKFGKVSGKFIYETCDSEDFPSVGDFVMVSYKSKEDTAIIHNILRRRSVFLRSFSGKRDRSQVIASNIDNLFICMSLNNNFNLNRLERYLSIAFDSGSTPIIVLTKSDLCENLNDMVLEVEKISCYSDIIITSIFEDVIPKFQKYFKEGITCAFVGSSGVGKSTLINKLLGEEVLKTNGLSSGDRGKHTTTGRELFLCPLGGVLIDTPGMREIGIDYGNLDKSFEDIEKLSLECKFSDCSHTNEPGCKVIEAIEKGVIDKRRIDNYFKLRNELSYDGLNSRQIENLKIKRMFKEVGGIKNAKRFVKSKRK